MNKTSDKLLLRVTSSFLGVIGYGNVYRCRVVKVIEGTLEEESIRVTILAGDKSKLDFISSHLDNEDFLIGFKKREDNEPYVLMPISGFVDKNRSSWEIEFLKDE